MADLHTIRQIQQVLSRGLNVTVDADDGSMQVHPFALQGLEYLRISGRIYYTSSYDYLQKRNQATSDDPLSQVSDREIKNLLRH